MKLQTFLVSSAPFIPQADRHFTAVNLLLGGITLAQRGAIQIYVLIAVLHVAPKPIQCRFVLRRGELRFGESAVIQLQPLTPNHIVISTFQVFVPEPGAYEVVAYVGDQEFSYPLPFELPGAAPGVVSGGVN